MLRRWLVYQNGIWKVKKQKIGSGFLFPAQFFCNMDLKSANFRKMLQARIHFFSYYKA